ncbi:CHAT domain-containing protein [Chitinophaga sp. SYP-B3965]|uniref:CHAT domain-containing protein n=1 Tax=Chitinophaga sp. SYP-B3965 TaxID=2663120 RepID=UPI001299D4F7|nr:CHAT domain-containing protein [Chitinophaga sp. SYP-B3965]MRG44991.1 CHAT domain-containing protein [Chitinophaga sp. SYP-B3965]
MPERKEILLFVHSSIELPNVKNELIAIRDRSPVSGKVEVRENGATNFDALDKALRNPYDQDWMTMLHYAGHSFKDGIIVEENGQHKVLGVDALKVMIKAHKVFRFVFLNSCNAANIATQFLEAGVPFVVGTTSEVKDTDALLIATKFYDYLSQSPCSIPNAFKLTNEYFIAHKNDLSVLLKDLFGSFSDDLTGDNGCRTLKLKGQSKENDYPWKLYIREDVAAALQKAAAARSAEEHKLLERTNEWTLVPQYKIELSNDLNSDYQHKILCLYTKKSEKYYTAFKNCFSTPGQKHILIQGVWDLFEGKPYRQELFEQELEAAHAVIHLVEGPDYLQEKYIISSLQKINNIKAHARIPIAALQDAPFKAMGWYQQAIELEANATAKFFGPTFPELVKKIPAADQLGKIQNALTFYSESLHNFLFQHTDTADPELLSKELIRMPFDIEQGNISNIFNTCSHKKLFFSHIEGTENCAQALIIQKIRASKGIQQNVKSIRISLLKPAPILTTDAFWEEMMRVTDTPKFGDKAQYPLKCIHALLGKLKQDDVVIVMEDITDAHQELYKEIQQTFWNDLVAEFKANHIGTHLFENALLFIIVNYHKDVKELPSFVPYDEAASFKISPVTCISKAEWQYWYVSQAIFLKKLPHKDNYYRKEVMMDICKSLRVKPNIIDEKVLKYD